MRTKADHSTSKSRTPLYAGLGAVLIAGVLVAWGVASRAHDVNTLQQWSDARSIPVVSLIQPGIGGATQDLKLPGDLQAENAAQTYAKEAGYVKAWYQDIGARVKTGQVLAIIDAPELDQQVDQAKADLASAEANEKLAQSTAKRWNDLLSTQSVSKQEADEKNGDLSAKTALVNASNANLQRLLAMKSYTRITAPFDGMVTARNAEIGALVNSGSSSQAPMFTVSDVRKMRVFVRAPQSFAALVHPGMLGTLTLPEYPGRAFPATLVRSSGAISDQSGTLLVELEANNPGGELKPGDYAQVSFKLPTQAGEMTVPASALMFRKNGLQVAVLGADNKVATRSITVARDLGAQVVVSGGVSAEDRVIDNPPDSLQAGDTVRVAQKVGS